MAQDPNYTNIDLNTNKEYIENMMKEMSDYHQILSSTYSYFSNSTLTFSDDYYEYLLNNGLRIFTLSNNIENIDYIPFSNALSRLTTVIFDTANVNNDYTQIRMSNRNSYEIMINVLNDYLIRWRDLTFILVKDVKTNINEDNTLIITFGISFLISSIGILGIKRLINKFVDDREKPIDLFLTIKKAKFEELKASSESFLNKLLNKFFGSEEADEEPLADSVMKMTTDDINIAKCNI
jgi:hypothetical protein